MGRIFLVLLMAFVVALLFEDSRSVIKEQASPLFRPLHGWITKQEMARITTDLETWDEVGRPFPNPREFQWWLNNRYQTDVNQRDAWENEYWLVGSGRVFSVHSAGPDGVRYTDDDLSQSGERSSGRR